MTKYISIKGGSRVNRYHSDPDCTNLKADVQEATESELEYHDLEPCSRCITGYDHDNPTPQNWKYQNASIDEDNDPLDRIHE